MTSEKDLRVANEVVRNCVDSAKRVDCDCEDLWCMHWESKVGQSFATAITAARAEQREVDARIVESQADPNWNLHYRKIAAAIRAGKE